MTIYYLYVKTHRKTGLKYLGYTGRKDPYKYHGSGVRWLNHLRMHGFDFDTEIIKECKSKSEIAEYGIYYSRHWDVVNNKNWANLKEESGDGGSCSGTMNGMFNKTHTSEVKSILANEAQKRFKGKTYSELYGEEKANELKMLRSAQLKGIDHLGTANPMHGKNHSESTKQLQSLKAKNRPKIECHHCNKIIASSQYYRYHGDNCKLKS